MDNITENTTMAAEAVARMTHQHQEAPDMVWLVETLAGYAQAIEHEAVNLMLKNSIADATGELLEFIGTKLGEPRPASGPAATSDDSYRLLIYARVGANTSHGTLEDLYGILGALQVGQPKIFELFPASITVNYINTALTASLGGVREILAGAKLPVSLDLVAHDDLGFGLEGDLSATGLDVGPLGESL